MIGFPASSSDTYECGLGAHGASRIIAESLDQIGWEYSVTEYGVFHARVGLSGASWGENVTIEILPDGVIRVESRCAWPIQVFDWGKNRSNVRKFLDHLRQKEIRDESLGPGAEDLKFEKDGSSRVDKLFVDD